MNGLVLSLFPGADLLGRGFEAAGYCVVRGPDTVFGGDIRRFTALQVNHAFEGIIGGPPCQDFSAARRVAPTGYGMSMLNEFARVITEAEPLWWLMENVPRVPDLAIRGYHVQRFNVFAAEFGLRQLRNRSFQFGSRDGAQLVLLRGEKSQRLLKRAAMASDGKECRRSRTFADLCELQGLPRRFRIFGLSRRARFQIVGNGVPLPVGTAIAEAIRDRYLVNHSLVRLCVCGCGRTVTGKQVMATAACRKRMERRRVTAAADGHASADSQRLDDSQASSAESQDRSHSAAFAPFAAAAPGTAPEGLVQDGFKVCGAELLPGPDKAG